MSSYVIASRLFGTLDCSIELFYIYEVQRQEQDIREIHTYIHIWYAHIICSYLPHILSDALRLSLAHAKHSPILVFLFESAYFSLRQEQLIRLLKYRNASRWLEDARFTVYEVRERQ